MRHMSFAATEPQILAQTKTVTRRLGWLKAKVGDVVQPVRKSQGLKKGERVQKLGGPIRFTNVRREILAFMDDADVAREGFPEMSAADFLALFVRINNLPTTAIEVTRLEFEYLS